MPEGRGPAALVYPAFDLALKCSHVFNLLDARGAVGVTERAAYIQRVRARVRACCLRYLEPYKSAK
jgi:glycyl-tRNA synthetase alpha chain